MFDLIAEFFGSKKTKITAEEYSRELPKDKADRLNMDCIFPLGNELFLDLDTEESYKVFLIQRDLFMMLGHTVLFTESFSKSGAPHRHVVVTLDNEVSPEMRIALQACFGSDIRRELLSIDALFRGVDKPTALFKRRESSES